MGLFLITKTEVYKESYYIDADSEQEAFEYLRHNRREPDISENSHTLGTTIEEL